MTRVPSDPSERLEPTSVAERLAGTLRRQVLAAAQASLRALREVLAHLPQIDALQPQPTPQPHKRPSVPPGSPQSLAPTPERAAPALATPSVPPPSAPPADLLRTDAVLPAAYGSDRLVLLARDPHCLYAYWDLSGDRVAEVRTSAASDQLRSVLRIYDVTQIAFDAKPPTRFQDFSIAGDARSLYAYVGKPAGCFVAEVGYLRPDGGFFALARSQPVWTPRTEQPGAAPGRWMTVGWTERAAAGEVVPLTTTGTANVDPTPLALRQAPSSWPGPAPSAAQRGSWSLVRGRLATATAADAGNEP